MTFSTDDTFLLWRFLPIIGDTNYGRTRHNHYFAERFGGGRLMLAATGMAFQHPATGEPLQLHCEPEQSFMQVLSIFDPLPPLTAQ